MAENTGDYRGRPSGMWKDVSKIDLWKDTTIVHATCHHSGPGCRQPEA
jgi:hypothetical protein